MSERQLPEVHQLRIHFFLVCEPPYRQSGIEGGRLQQLDRIDRSHVDARATTNRIDDVADQETGCFGDATRLHIRDCDSALHLSLSAALDHRRESNANGELLRTSVDHELMFSVLALDR